MTEIFRKYSEIFGRFYANSKQQSFIYNNLKNSFKCTVTSALNLDLHPTLNCIKCITNCTLKQSKEWNVHTNRCLWYKQSNFPFKVYNKASLFCMQVPYFISNLKFRWCMYRLCLLQRVIQTFVIVFCVVFINSTSRCYTYIFFPESWNISVNNVKHAEAHCDR